MQTNHMQRPPQFSRRQLREWKRNAKAQAYRAFGLRGQSPDLTGVPDGDVARMDAARDKRARKAEKRVADALSTEVGQMQAVERRRWFDSPEFAMVCRGGPPIFFHGVDESIAPISGAPGIVGVAPAGPVNETGRWPDHVADDLTA